MFGRSIVKLSTVCLVQESLLSLTFYFDFHILLDILIIFSRVMYQAKTVCHMIAILNCLLFELSPMNKLAVDIIYTWLSICTADH